MSIRHRARCAIYTRVSTEHGLDLEFNSLDAQREACEAYVLSQKHEGWMALPTSYSDGGYSGGTLERPALKRLMADIRAGKLDIIVVYKVDRLTRSLADFAKLVELFDQHGVSFVSVTQAFNTTTSMGRLTLNVLLSFAQFEREVSGERIRDKVAAAKRKGIRMGGPVPLGYRLAAKRLVIDEAEAAHVRAIFSAALTHESLTAVMRHLDAAGLRTKQTVLRDGRIRGGQRFGKGALRYLLTNRVYLGEISHKGVWYPSNHPPIVAEDVFEAVGAALRERREATARRRVRMADLFPLQGRIFDDRGNRMTPTLARKKGVHYRYYVSAALAQGRLDEAGSLARAGAEELEAALARGLADNLADFSHSPATAEHKPSDEAQFAAILRVVVSAGALTVTLDAEAGSPDAPSAGGGSDMRETSGVDSAGIASTSLGSRQSKAGMPKAEASRDGPLGSEISLKVIPWSPSRQRRQRAVITPEATPGSPSAAEATRRLVAIARARHWLDDLVTGREPSTAAIARREGVTDRAVRKTLALAFTEPDAIKFLFGHQSASEPMCKR